MAAEAAHRWGSNLDAVVVYAQGAVCRRLAGGRVPPDGRVRVTGLPRSLDAGSLRVRVLGASGVRVVEARVVIEAGPSAPEGVGELQREVERRRDMYAAAVARRDRQLALIEEIAGLRPVPPPRRRDEPHRKAPAESWLALADFVEERLTRGHARLAELEKESRRAEHELRVAEDKLERASTDARSAQVGTTVCAALTLGRARGAEATADPDAEVEVEVEYQVPGAVWVPAYRLVHRQGDDSGSLVLRASVAQRTGEDWTRVRVAVSTADLRRRTDLPRLRSIRIGRRQPTVAPSGWREPPAGLTDLFAGYDAAGPSPAAAGAGSAPVAAGAVSRPAVVPPLPPAPQGYGAPPPGLPVAGGAIPAPAASAMAGRPGPASRSMAFAAPAPVMAAAPGCPVPPPPPEPATGPPRPSGDELDYAALVLSGPDEQRSRRGRLFPTAGDDPVAVEYRRRAAEAAVLPLPGHAVRPREAAGSFDHRFDAAARADIPSDGTWHTVPLVDIPIGLRTEYVCVPSVEETVYTTLVLSNATDRALLAGPVEVSVDDEFVLTAALPTLAPGGVRRLGLGPAEAIRVTRRTELHESASGLRGNTTVLDHRVHVELANRLGKPVTVEVRERVPVTSEQDVRIEERAGWKAPGGDEGPEHAPGTRLWRVDLPAGGTAALDGGYLIRIPAGKALVGGNRRS
ncbi:DUF4139 domain-containing protein [Streptomyces sp. NPDC127084]|uniref:DUF4139 domain-containing protein n=1 Tax=Streptomyces sp. NPDC127084 TaxID=3347133 RepID=UPI00365F48A9